MTTLADRVLDTLVEAGVRTIWAVQGGSISPFLDAAEARDDVTVRYAPTEAGAAYAADGACRARGRLVAASAVTTGPGVWGAMPGLLSSVTDGVPVCCVAGLPRLRDGFQPTLGLPPWVARYVVQGRIDEWLEPCGRVVIWMSPPAPSGSLQDYHSWLDRVLPTVTDEAIAAVWAAVGEPPPWVTADAGLTLAHVERVLRQRMGHGLVVPWGQAPMGAAVYMAHGIAQETGEEVRALVGDGSLHMQAQALDLETPGVSVVELDSRGYSAIRLYQDQHLGGRHHGSEIDWYKSGEACCRSVRAPW